MAPPQRHRRRGYGDERRESSSPGPADDIDILLDRYRSDETMSAVLREIEDELGREHRVDESSYAHSFGHRRHTNEETRDHEREILEGSSNSGLDYFGAGLAASGEDDVVVEVALADAGDAGADADEDVRARRDGAVRAAAAAETTTRTETPLVEQARGTEKTKTTKTKNVKKRTKKKRVPIPGAADASAGGGAAAKNGKGEGSEGGGSGRTTTSTGLPERRRNSIPRMVAGRTA